MKNQINQNSCLTTDTISNAKKQQPPNTIIKNNKPQKNRTKTNGKVKTSQKIYQKKPLFSLGFKPDIFPTRFSLVCLEKNYRGTCPSSSSPAEGDDLYQKPKSPGLRSTAGDPQRGAWGLLMDFLWPLVPADAPLSP